MALRIIVSLLFAAAVAIIEVNGNFEGDVLYSWKKKLSDPNKILQSWDPTLVNPCTWFHVTCNSRNRVTRVDLGNAGLSGPLIPQLGLLTHLQYLEVYANKMYGTIPTEIGDLTSLVSLDLYQNQFSGVIPSSIGNLINLRFLRLNSNNLTGKLPLGVINLVQYGNLVILNVADNNLAGTVRSTNSTEAIVTTIVQDPKSKKMN